MTKMDPTAVLMLDDEVNQRIVVTWHLVPRSIREGQSIYDIASVCCSLAGCTIDQAIGRLHSLRAMGVINTDGSIDTQAADYLTRKAVGRLVTTSRHNPESVLESMMSKVPVSEFRAWLAERAPELFTDMVPEDSDSASRRRDQNTPVRVQRGGGEDLPQLEWEDDHLHHHGTAAGAAHGAAAGANTNGDGGEDEGDDETELTEEEIEAELALGSLRRLPDVPDETTH
jgi:hypothetical protein